MTEPAPVTIETKPRTPLEAELLEGFILEPEETVVFDPPNDAVIASAQYPVGNGVKVTGRAVAEVVIGGQEDNTRALIIETGSHGPAGKPQRDYMVLLPQVGKMTQPYAYQLDRHKRMRIGRSYEGQHNLPDAVSRDHCEIGLAEDGRIEIVNHKPTNHTGLRVIGRYQRAQH